MSERKIIDYRLVCGNSYDLCVEEVKDALKNGWELHGPLTVTPFSPDAMYFRYYMREMVKYAP